MHIKNISFLQKTLLILSMFFAMITLLYEIFWSARTDFPEGSNNIVFVLDVSQSMNVEDMWEFNRLDTAKRKIIDIISETPWNNYGLNIFAWESLRVLPFTNDIWLISTFLLGLDSRNITKQGSDIPGAFAQASESFNDQQSWTVILISDGTDDRIQIPREIKNQLQQQNLKVLVLGVWTVQGWFIPSDNPLSRYKLFNWEIVTSSLNSESLQSLAQEIWWTYMDIDEYLDYSLLWESSNPSPFPLIFILFLISWLTYLALLYKNIFSKTLSQWNIN